MIHTQAREEIADKVITKVNPDYLDYLASFKNNAYDAYNIKQIRCSNFVLEYVELPTCGLRLGAVVYDEGRKYFEDNLVTAHLPECDGFREDRSYRILGVDNVGSAILVDDHRAVPRVVMLDLDGDNVQVTPQYNAKNVPQKAPLTCVDENVSLSVDREYNESGDVEHNHFKCPHCHASAVKSEYLDLDEHSITEIECEHCLTVIRLTSKTWYASYTLVSLWRPAQ